MNLKVKICGVRDVQGVKAAQTAGADYIGFNFVPSSKRHVTKQQVKKLFGVIEENVGIVGIFQNQEADFINDIAATLHLDFAQLHGDETMDFVSRVQTKVIKAFQLDRNSNVKTIMNKMQTYKTCSFLLDRQVQGAGDMIDLNIAKMIAQKFPVYFAGGLTPENVADIVRAVRPYGVDIAGGVETSGQQDTQKITEFVKNAKGVDL